MRPGSWAAAAKRPLSQPESLSLTVDGLRQKKERDVVRGNRGRRNVSDEPF